MSINATAKGGFTLAPQGTFLARCIGMVHIGTVPKTYKNDTKMSNIVRITWELPNDIDKATGKPFTVSQEYGLYLSTKSNLRKIIDAWRGKSLTDEEADKFDVVKLLSHPCMVTITHKTSGSGNVYSIVASVSGVPKGITVPAQVHPTVHLDYDNWNEEIYKSLPGFLQVQIRTSEEYGKKFGGQVDKIADKPLVSEEESSDLPF